MTAVPDARLVEVIDRLTKALHEQVVELQITETELRAALTYLTEVGAKDEFILLSDVLGVSVLVNEITHGTTTNDATASNVEGPFYRLDAPMLSPPYALARLDEPGDVLFVSGRVTDSGSGSPLEGAILDVWQANADGLYDNQVGEAVNLRGKLPTNQEGMYEFRTVVPPPYEIPKHGPVGALLRGLGRHAFRPAHLHAKVSKDGYTPLTTMVFISDDPYLGSDTIGAVKDSLIVPLERHEDHESIAGRGLDQPYSTCSFDVSLRPGDA